MQSQWIEGLLGQLEVAKVGQLIDKVSVQGSTYIWGKHLCGVYERADALQFKKGGRAQVGKIGIHWGCPCAVNGCIGSQGHWDGRDVHELRVEEVYLREL